jgi:hypothetical protein
MADVLLCSRCRTKTVRSRGLCRNCYQLRRVRDTAYGRWESTHVDPVPVQQRIAELKSFGLGYRRVAELAGLPIRTVRELDGRRPRAFVTKVTADAILAVQLPQTAAELAADGAFIPATGSTRRLQALTTAGYTGRQLCAEIRGNQTSLKRLVSGRQTVITAAKARDIAAAFTRLQMTPGPSTRARLRGQRNGWPPPLAWDEDTIDDPAAQPDTGQTRKPTFADRYTDAREIGLTDEQAAQRLGIKLDSLERQVYRNGLKAAS